jgi:hypothetical protein
LATKVKAMIQEYRKKHQVVNGEGGILKKILD